jgi:hypothetical protein
MGRAQGGTSFNAFSMTSTYLTVEPSITECNIRGYTYAGVEYLIECYCTIKALQMGPNQRPIVMPTA